MFSKFGGFTVPSARQIYRFQQLQSSIRCFAIDRRRDGHDKPGRSRKNSIRERIRGNSSSSPSKREQEESNITGMKNILEKIDEGLDVPLKGSSKGKLAKSLTKTEIAALSQTDQGTLDVLSEEICDALNDALDSRTFAHTFPGILQTSKVVEIDYVHLNKDVSHVTAYWKSDMVNVLVSELSKKQKLEKDMEKIERYDEEMLHLKKDDVGSNYNSKTNIKSIRNGNDKCVFDSSVVLARAEKHVTKSLQGKEGKFRSFIMKHIEFRRVPRVFFKMSDGLEMSYAAAMDGEDDPDRTGERFSQKAYTKKGEQFLHGSFIEEFANNREY